MSWELDGRPLSSVLVSRLRYLGDIVMATAVVRVLRRGDPDLRIGFLCEEGFGPVLAGLSELDRVHLLASRRRGADARARSSAGPARTDDEPESAVGTAGMVSRLRRARYDLAVDLFFNPRSAWLLRLAGIPGRIGGTRSWRRHLYTHTVLRPEYPAGPPSLDALAPGGLGEHLCRLAPLVHRPTGAGFARWLAQEYGAQRPGPRLARTSLTPAAGSALRGIGVQAEEHALVMAPGATWLSKQWPASGWRSLIRVLGADRGAKLAILVPPGRSADWAELADAIPADGGGVLPELGLRDVLSLLSGAAGLISVDGGILHAAVGLGLPTVGIFGPTDPRIWFPYEHLGPFRVVATRPACHPCDRHTCDEFICLPELGAAQVAAAWRELTSSPAQTRPECPYGD